MSDSERAIETVLTMSDIEEAAETLLTIVEREQAVETLLALPPELLESILSRFDRRELLQLRQVNGKFGDTIANSLPLQQITFTCPPSRDGEARTFEVPKLNPLLTTSWDDKRRDVVFEVDSRYYQISTPRSGQAANPFSVIERSDRGEYFLDLRMREFLEVPANATVLVEDSSAATMHFSRPVCPIHLTLNYQPESKGGCGPLDTRYEIEGATVREVLRQLVEKHRTRHERLTLSDTR